jgi:hypothetical protein
MDAEMSHTWSLYKKVETKHVEMRPYVAGEDLSKVGVSTEVKLRGGPKVGDMICRDPENHDDQWTISMEYLKEKYEPVF